MMDIQQIITLALVAVAAVYLGRLGWHASKSMWSGRPGYGSACAKCIMAEIAEHKRTRANGGASPGGRPAPRDGGGASTVVPLSSVRRVPSRRDD